MDNYIPPQDVMLFLSEPIVRKTNQMRVASWGILYAHLPTPCTI